MEGCNYWNFGRLGISCFNEEGIWKIHPKSWESFLVVLSGCSWVCCRLSMLQPSCSLCQLQCSGWGSQDTWNLALFQVLLPSRVCKVTGSWWLNTIDLVFLALIFKLILPHWTSTLFRRFWAWWICSDRRAISSAKSRSVRISGPTLLLWHFFRQKLSSSSLPSMAFLSA